MILSEIEIGRCALYILLSCALADGIPDSQELDAIKQKMLAHFGGRSYDLQTLFTEVQAEILATPAHEFWEAIESKVNAACPTDASKQKMIRDLEEIIESDGYINEKEMAVFLRIKQLVAF